MTTTGQLGDDGGRMGDMKSEHTAERDDGGSRWVTGVVGGRVGRATRMRAARWYRQIHPRYRVVTVGAWGLVFALYAVGDTGLTTLVLAMGGFEMNPVARAFIDVLGYPGLAVQKGIAVALLALIWRYYPTVGTLPADPWRLVVPTIAAARGLQLVLIHASNIAVLL